MKTISFISQKGGVGKTTLAIHLAVAFASDGLNVAILDLDPQASLVRWGERRLAAKATHKIIVEPLEAERLPRLRTVLDGLAGVGFTVAILDTAGTDGEIARFVGEAVDLCLLPARPTRLDIDATAASFRAAFLAKRRAAFVLNQCPPAYRSLRASEAAKSLAQLGVLAEPMLSSRMDFQDATGVGLGVTEYGRCGRAAREIGELWSWIHSQFEMAPRQIPDSQTPRRVAA